MKRTLWAAAGVGALLGAGTLWLGVTRSAQASEVAWQAPVPAESPGGGECYEWSYPKKTSCGKLSGTKECKTRPSIESSEDEDKKADCTPTKGDLCLCD
jgi:hypothetical protein